MFFRLVLLVSVFLGYLFFSRINTWWFPSCVYYIDDRSKVECAQKCNWIWSMHSTYTFHKLNALTCLKAHKNNDLWVLLLSSLLFAFSLCCSFFRFSYSEAFVFCFWYFPNSSEFRISFRCCCCCCCFFLIMLFSSICHYIFHHMIMMRFNRCGKYCILSMLCCCWCFCSVLHSDTSVQSI